MPGTKPSRPSGARTWRHVWPSPWTSSPMMASAVPSGYARTRSAIAGVVRMYTPSPSVLPTYAVSGLDASAGALVFVAAATGAGAAEGEAAATGDLATVGASAGEVPCVAGVGVGSGALP